MRKQNLINSATSLLVLLFVVLACGGGDQKAEANKIVDEANKKLEEAKSLYTKTDARNTALFSAKIQTLQQFESYKAKMGGEAKAIVADFDKVSDMLKDVSKQYDNVSRMKLDDKYKEYARLKSDEFAKRSDAINIHKGNAQAFLDIDDQKTLSAKFTDNNNRSDALFKEAEDIAGKAKKIEDDNKNLFKQS